MKDLKVRSFILRHRLISFIRDIDRRGFRRLSLLLPRLLMPEAGKLGQFILKTPMGFRIIIEPSTDTGVEKSLYETGYYEKGILHFIAANLKPNGCFVDIGANIGLMSLFVAQKFPEVGVYAFEAHPENYKLLEANIRLNDFPSISAYHCALGDRHGEVEIYDDPSFNRGGASIKRTVSGNTGYTVEMKTLDELLSGQKIAMVKIDVEGSEAEVLAGARELIIRDSPVLIIEIAIERRKDNETDKILSFIESLENYEVYKLKGSKERRSQLVRISSPEDIPVHDNIICIASS